MGHSMGAALTALALSEGETRFARATLCAPMIEFLPGPVPFWLARPTIQLATARSSRTTPRTYAKIVDSAITATTITSK